MISDDIRLAEELYRRVDVEACLNDLNDRHPKRLESSGEVYLSNAVIDGKFLLRACILNFRTALEDIEALPEIVIRHGKALHPKAS